MQVFETTVSFTKPTILTSTVNEIYQDFSYHFQKPLTVANYCGTLLKITGMLSFGGIIEMLNILELHGLTTKDVSLHINEPRYY